MIYKPLRLHSFRDWSLPRGTKGEKQISARPLLKLLLHIITLTAALHCSAQNFITVSGKVIDHETKEPLSFASVTIDNSPRGTIANANGQFVLHIPESSANTTLHITMLGYQSFELSLSTINPSTQQLISLKPAVAYLPEVVISDSLDAGQILRRAYDRLRYNYSSSPYQLEGFYREIQKADGKYVSLIEAAVLIDSRGMTSKSHDRMKLTQLRKSSGYNNPHVPFWDNYNLLAGFLQQDFVKHKKKSLIKFTDAFRKENTSIDDVPVYVVVLNERADFWLNTLYIRCDDYAIIRFEENYDRQHAPERSWNVETNITAKAFPQLKTLSVTYRAINGKYFPERRVMKFRAIYKDGITGKQLLDFEIDHQFVVTNAVFDNIREISKEEVLNPSLSLKKLPARYDSSFWVNYNMIRESPLDSLIRKDLESQMKLDEQFRKN